MHACLRIPAFATMGRPVADTRRRLILVAEACSPRRCPVAPFISSDAAASRAPLDARRSRDTHSPPRPSHEASGRRVDGGAATPTGVLAAEAASAMCVQKFDDSLSPAIHTTYRISLRSSSLREPRHPLLRVVWRSVRRARARGARRIQYWLAVRRGCVCQGRFSSPVWVWNGVNDPSAGSPTETLLRLLLPLDAKV